MKRIVTRHPIIFALLAIMLFLFSNVSMAMEGRQQVTIIGEVNEESQIIARDGTLYEIGMTEKGNEVKALISAVIEATGTVVEDAGVKILYIESFKILEQI